MAGDIEMSEAERTGEAPRPRRVAKTLPRKVLETLASIRITVLLLVLSCILVFLGTIAQIDNGIWRVMSDYFRSWVVEVPVRSLAQFVEVFFRETPTLKESSLTFPFPAGYTLGFALVVNLLAAHVVRFKLSWNRIGILATHAGLLILMAGEFVTGQLAVESKMVLAEGEKSNFVEASNTQELAVVRTIETPEGKRDEVSVVPHGLIKAGRVISDEKLPFVVRVLEYYPNSGVMTARELAEHNAEMAKSPKTSKRVLEAIGPAVTIEGTPLVLTRKPQESGVDTESRVEVPSAKFQFSTKEGEVIGERLLSNFFTPNTVSRQIFFAPQYVEVGGVSYRVDYRPERIYKPYAIELKKFERVNYAGTSKARSFASYVTVFDASGNVARPEAKIWMNHPMRLEGDDIYQSGFLPEQVGPGTVLQVVRNPGSRLPYVACLVMTLGMVVQFGLSLTKFLSRRSAGGK